MRILSIETSCDETAIALVEASGGIKKPHFKVLQNIVSSQVALHAPFGGVVPNIAKREHIKNLPTIFGQLDILPSTTHAVREGKTWASAPERPSEGEYRACNPSPFS